MDISRFSEANYWFNTNPGSNFGLLYPMLSFATILLLIAVGISVLLHFKHVPKALRKYILKIKSRSYTFSFLAYLFTFFRYEGAILLSMRLWWLIYAIFFAIFVIQSILDFAVHYPADLKNLATKKKNKRYQAKKRK